MFILGFASAGASGEAEGERRRRSLRGAHSASVHAARAITLGLALLVCAAGAAGIEAADIEAARQLGKRALRARNYPAAADQFRVVVAEDPKDADGWLDLGRSLSAMQDWDGAIHAYEKVNELEPRNSKALNNLGNVYFRMGVYPDAARYYDKALELDPDYLLALFHHGYVLFRENENTTAADRFDRCLRVEPRSDRERRTQLDCRFYQGVLRYRADAFDEAAAILQQVLSIHPNHIEAHHYLALCYRRLGRDEEARQLLGRHRQLLKSFRSDQPIRKAIDS